MFTTRWFLFIIAVLILMAGVLVLGLRYEVQRAGALKAQNLQLQQSLREQGEALQAMEAQQLATDQLLLQREQQRNRLQREVTATQLRLKHLEESADAAYRSCLDQPLPDAVLHELHELHELSGAPGSEKTVPAQGAYRIDPCAFNRWRYLS